MIAALIDDLKKLQNDRPDNLVTFVQRSLRYSKRYRALMLYNSKPYDYQFHRWNVVEPQWYDYQDKHPGVYVRDCKAYRAKKANNFAEERARLDCAFKVYQETEGLKILIESFDMETRLYAQDLPIKRGCEGWVNPTPTHEPDSSGNYHKNCKELRVPSSDPANDPQYTSIDEQIKLSREKSLKARTAKRKKLNKRLMHQRSPRKAPRKLPQAKTPKNPVSAARAFATKSSECTSYEHGYIVDESSVTAFTSYGVLSIDHAGEGVGIFSAKTQTKLEGQSARYFEHAAQWRAEYGMDVIDHTLQIDAQELFESVYAVSSMHSWDVYKSGSVTISANGLEWSMRDSTITLHTSKPEVGDATAEISLKSLCVCSQYNICGVCAMGFKLNCDGPTVEKILRNMSGQVKIEIGRSYLGKSFMRLTSGDVTGIVVIS